MDMQLEDAWERRHHPVPQKTKKIRFSPSTEWRRRRRWGI